MPTGPSKAGSYDAAARLAACGPRSNLPEWPQKTRFWRAKAERARSLRLVNARSRSFTEATSLLPRRLRSCLPYVGAMGGAAPIWQPPLPAMASLVEVPQQAKILDSRSDQLHLTGSWSAWFEPWSSSKGARETVSSFKIFSLP